MFLTRDWCLPGHMIPSYGKGCLNRDGPSFTGSPRQFCCSSVLSEGFGKAAALWFPRAEACYLKLTRRLTRSGKPETALPAALRLQVVTYSLTEGHFWISPIKWRLRRKLDWRVVSRKGLIRPDTYTTSPDVTWDSHKWASHANDQSP